MQNKGVIKEIDNLGRIVIPKEIRAQLDVTSAEDSFEIYMEEDAIILKKHETSCIFCGSEKALTTHEGKTICIDCVRKISKIPN